MKEIGSNEFLGVKVFKDFHDFKHAVLSNFEDNELPLMLKRSIYNQQMLTAIWLEYPYGFLAFRIFYFRMIERGT